MDCSVLSAKVTVFVYFRSVTKEALSCFSTSQTIEPWIERYCWVLFLRLARSSSKMLKGT